jgi:hypothetical protein
MQKASRITSISKRQVFLSIYTSSSEYHILCSSKRYRNVEKKNLENSSPKQPVPRMVYDWLCRNVIPKSTTHGAHETRWTG